VKWKMFITSLEKMASYWLFEVLPRHSQF